MSRKKTYRRGSLAPGSRPSAPKPAELSLVDDREQMPLRGGAYNPYDIDPAIGRKQLQPVAKPDLRKLSQWLKLKREVEELKKEEPSDE